MINFNLLKGVQVSNATSQANIAVLHGDADISTRPSGLQDFDARFS